ncbi:homeobox protein VENTX [Callithrix jacchus]|uniref:homeobox protein VENTX n=1 Tax=Callithrix jacchus TaxID=9483 RepID=UPI00159F5F2B|nr:homeobox protein VENTX [Callithrix jacchus]
MGGAVFCSTLRHRPPQPPPSRPLLPRGRAAPTAPGLGTRPGGTLGASPVAEGIRPSPPLAGTLGGPRSLRRRALSTEQVRALEGVFRHHHYLGPLERKRLARELQLSEVQVKMWFQNRRMKHKQEVQDAQLNSSFSGSLHVPPARLASGLQLLCPWAPLPRPQALMLPPGSFWGLCQVEQEALASA